MVLLLLPAGGAFADHDGTIKVGLDTTLSSDHHGNIVVTDGVTLDCSGFAVIGLGSGWGIDVDGVDDVTIRNCDVSGFNAGIRFVGVNGGLLVDSTSTANNFSGITVEDSSGVIVKSTAAYDNGFSGFYIQWSSDNEFRNNTSTGNGLDGFFVSNSDDNLFTNNKAKANDRHGMNLIGSSGNTMEKNKASMNGGFDLIEGDEPSSPNTYTKNKFETISPWN